MKLTLMAAGVSEASADAAVEQHTATWNDAINTAITRVANVRPEWWNQPPDTIAGIIYRELTSLREKTA